MNMATKKPLIKEAEEFKKQFAKKLLSLVTSGFGLVAALAWNELIKETVNTFIKPYFGNLCSCGHRACSTYYLSAE